MNQRTTSLLAFAIAFLLLTTNSGVVFAQGGFKDLFSPEQGEEMGVLDILSKLTVTIRTIFLPLLTLVVFWAGFTMATAKGNEAQYTQGKRILFQALIGTAIIVAAEQLVQIAREFQRRL